MSESTAETWERPSNPLDSVEDVLNAHNWTFNRVTNDELMVQVAGKSCDYRLFFIWQEDMQALQFCCQYDLIVADDQYAKAAQSLMVINENLWMGHFDLPKETGTPSFRQTCLMRGMSNVIHDQIEDLVDISLVQCERYYHVFHLLTHKRTTDDQSLALALMDTAGES